MIKLKNTDVYGFEAAIRGMRNPWNSWEKSDSFEFPPEDDIPWIGKNDLALMKKLVAAGSDHSKFMRMITVFVDVTAPLYWWKEFDTYKVGTVRNSCSTMHTITNKEFDLDDFSHEHLIEESIEVLNNIIEMFNEVRSAYIDYEYYDQNGTWDAGISCKKDVWWQIIQLLPSSYNQRATVQLNYAVLRNMYHSRKNHPLDEWRDFCRWIETLPYSELITGGNADEMQP